MAATQASNLLGRPSYELYDSPSTLTGQSSFEAPPNVERQPTASYMKRQPTQQVTQIRSPSQYSKAGPPSKVWKIHWRAPVLMVGYLLLGTGFALGHHFYWYSLHDTVVPSETDQEWSQRLGIAAAFIAQSLLTLAVGVAYTQRVWVSVKRRPLTLGGLDKVFSLQDDVFAFLSWEVLTKAKFLCLLGLVAWCIPISSTFSSATLSVRSGTVTNVTEVNVPVPDYTNSTETYWAVYEGVGRLDGASPAITRLASATSTSMYILPFSAPFPNSSYSVEFYGPSFRCQNLSTAVLDNSDNLDFGDAGSLQEAWDKTMNGTFNSGIDYVYVGVSPENLSGVSMKSHLFITTDYFGAFEKWGQNYSCHYWNTSYALDFTFSNGEQATEIRALDYVAPLSIASAGVVNTYAEGEIQYWTMFTSLMNILVATIGWGSTGSMQGDASALLQSGVAACPEVARGSADEAAWFALYFADWMCRAGSVPGAVEDLSRNLTLSLLSSALLANETRAGVTAHAAANFYTYNWRNLVIAYAVAVAAASVCVAVGAHALLANGYSAGASFSSILLTTRNPDLDNLAQGHCLGARPMPEEVSKTVLRFGVLHSQPCDPNFGGHAAFGLRDDVRTLRKGEQYW